MSAANPAYGDVWANGGNEYRLRSLSLTGRWDVVREDGYSDTFDNGFLVKHMKYIGTQFTAQNGQSVAPQTAPVVKQTPQAGEFWGPYGISGILYSYEMLSCAPNLTSWLVKSLQDGKTYSVRQQDVLNNWHFISACNVAAPAPGPAATLAVANAAASMMGPIVVNRVAATSMMSEYISMTMKIDGPPKDPNYPHTCPRCAKPAYLGVVPNSVDCSNSACATRKK